MRLWRLSDVRYARRFDGGYVAGGERAFAQ